MATERDFELLDDFLSNRMQGEERLAFEKKLEGDPSLQRELKVQLELVEGIRRARAAELKSMLNQTVISGTSSSTTIGKIVAAVLIAGVVGTGLYYFLREDSTPVKEDTTPITENTTPAEEPVVEVQPDQSVPDEHDQQPKPQADEQTPVKKDNTATKKKQTNPDPTEPAKQPELAPYDPTKELNENNDKPQAIDESGVRERGSNVPVEIDNTNKKLDFHYQFKEGKLFLFGSFEKDLYEILEFFNNNKRTVFLYYNSKYYLLDEEQIKPTPLKAITDQSLIQKLNERRGKGN